MSSKDWISVRSPRFEALFSTGGEPVRLLLPLPCPPVSTSPGEGLPGSLFEGSCGRCKRRSMPNRLNVDMYARLLLPFQKTKMFSSFGEKYGLTEWRNGQLRARLLLHTQREGPPKAREQAVLYAGRNRLVSEKLQALSAQGNHEERH